MLIRKVSIGPDYKDAMHYSSKQNVLGDKYIIHLIEENEEEIIIYIENEAEEVYKWKSFKKTMPMSIEYNINF